MGLIIFDHLIGAGEQRGRHSQSEGLRRLEIDHQLESGRLDDRQVRGPCRLQDATDVDTRVVICPINGGSLAHQAARAYSRSE